jgi:Ca2+-binding RTX toxin-like protein
MRVDSSGIYGSRFGTASSRRARSASHLPQAPCLEPLENRTLFAGVAFYDPKAPPEAPIILTDGNIVDLTWDSMPDTRSGSLNVTLNGSPILSNHPITAGPGKYHYGSELGNYEAHISVVDASGRTASADLSWTVIDDDTTGPGVAFGQTPLDPQTEQNPVPLNWLVPPDASSLHLLVTRDGVVLHDGPAPATNTFDYGNRVGQYSAVLTAYDNDNDRIADDRTSATATKSWRVVDDDVTPPTVTFRFPVVPQPDSGPRSLTWEPSPDVSHGVLTVRRNGTVIYDGPAPTNNEYAAYGNEVGEYSASITVYDNDFDNGNESDRSSATATHTWTVYDDDTTGPGISFHETPLDPQTDHAPVALNWLRPADVSSMRLIVTLDGQEIYNGDAPASNNHPYGNRLGQYQATLTAYDNDDDREEDDRSSTTITKSWRVIDDDNQGPEVSFNFPQVTQTDTLVPDGPMQLSWIMSADVSESTLTVSVDGDQIYSGEPLTSGALTYGNRVGTYTAVLTAYDNDIDRGAGDRSRSTATHTWQVVDDDADAPAIIAGSTPGGSQTDVNTLPRQLTWDVTDVSGLSSITVRVTRDTGSGAQQIFESNNATRSGSFDITSQGAGLFVITVSATDADNDRPGDSLSATSGKSLNVLPQQAPPPPPPPPPAAGSAALENDPLNAGRRMLVIRGTENGDVITISRALDVVINGQQKGSFGGAAVSRVVVHALGGDDFVWAADSFTGRGDSDGCVFNRVTNPTWLFGGAGNDLLVGGAGGGLVIGGLGRDVIVGGAGRDLLVGGSGSDVIAGSGSDDILIAGLTAYDANETALGGVLKEWSRTDRSYLNRINALKGNALGLNGSYALRTDGSLQTVFDDGAADEVDILAGMAGEDWFLYNTGADGGARDVVVGSSSSEVGSDIDRT